MGVPLNAGSVSGNLISHVSGTMDLINAQNPIASTSSTNINFDQSSNQNQQQQHHQPPSVSAPVQQVPLSQSHQQPTPTLTEPHHPVQQQPTQQPQTQQSQVQHQGNPAVSSAVQPIATVTSLPITINTNVSGGDSHSTASLTTQARMLLEESVIGSDEGDR